MLLDVTVRTGEFVLRSGVLGVSPIYCDVCGSPIDFCACVAGVDY